MTERKLAHGCDTRWPECVAALLGLSLWLAPQLGSAQPSPEAPVQEDPADEQPPAEKQPSADEQPPAEKQPSADAQPPAEVHPPAEAEPPADASDGGPAEAVEVETPAVEPSQPAPADAGATPQKAPAAATTPSTSAVGGPAGESREAAPETAAASRRATSVAAATKASGATGVEGAGPRKLRFTVGFGVHAGWYHDRGYERFGPKQADAQFQGLLGVDALRLERGFVLAVELSTEQGRQRGDTGLDAGDLQLTTQSYMAALVPRFEATSWLWPHLRVGVGALSSRLRVEPPGSAVFEQTDWGVAVDLALGVSFVVPRSGWRLDRTLRAQPLARLEVGYRFAPDASFDGVREDGDGIPVQRASLGRLARGAILLRFVVGTRF